MRSKTVQVGVHPEPQQWAEKQFAGAKLTDIRRVARVKKIAETMAVHPGRSIPKLCDSPYAVKATYNLFKHEEATPDNIQAGHRAVVLQEMRQPGVYLLFNWLRVLDIAESSQVDQCVGHQLHASWLQVFRSANTAHRGHRG